VEVIGGSPDTPWVLLLPLSSVPEIFDSILLRISCYAKIFLAGNMTATTAEKEMLALRLFIEKLTE